MTSEEGVEEKREERDVRGAAEEAGKYFKLWMDKKYFIDEYDPPASPPLSRLTSASRDVPFSKSCDSPDFFTSY
jgi:hypothetical protein